jgi:hypothetical protein
MVMFNTISFQWDCPERYSCKKEKIVICFPKEQTFPWKVWCRKLFFIFGIT